jgi:hypothetical protein
MALHVGSANGYYFSKQALNIMKKSYRRLLSTVLSFSVQSKICTARRFVCMLCTRRVSIANDVSVE